MADKQDRLIEAMVGAEGKNQKLVQALRHCQKLRKHLQEIKEGVAQATDSFGHIPGSWIVSKCSKALGEKFDLVDAYDAELGDDINKRD